MSQLLKVLIVDDEELFRLNIGALLEDLGYNVIEAGDGREGLELIEQEAPDLVLSDLRMPEMDGLSLVAAMQEKYPETPVIVISGVGSLKDAVEAVRRGAWDYMTKPIEDTDGFDFIIRRTLERARLITENRRYREHLEELVREQTGELETRMAELRESEEKFRQVTESIREVFWLGSPDWNEIYYISPAFEDLWGHSCDDLYHSPSIWLKSIVEKDRVSVKRAMHGLETRDTNEIRFPHYQIRRPDGSLRWISARAFLIRDTRGQVYRIAGIAEDITERMQAKEERRSLENQLQQAQKMEAVGQLAGGVAHDFNNLLHIIIGYSEMLMDQFSPGGGLHKKAQHILTAAKRGGTLVRQLLLFSRQEAMQPKHLDLNELISNLLKMLTRVMGEHIALDIHPGADLGMVYGDPGQLEQIIMNLCVNARDAISGEGKILIETKNVSPDDDFCEHNSRTKSDGYVLMSVSDNGHGIDLDTQEHIFDPFFTTKEVGKGTGLGLAAVYGIVRSHQGMIHLHSEPGHGTTFKIYLPVAEDVPSFPSEEIDISAPPSGGSETILLAEDEKELRNMFEKILQNSGYRVLSAQDGEEAIQIFNENPGNTDMALLDIVMPKADGHKVLEQIRVIRPEMPVIFMTGYSKGILPTDISSNSQYEIIQKPMSPSVLLRRIRSVLDAGR